jgi:hypothetical protein
MLLFILMSFILATVITNQSNKIYIESDLLVDEHNKDSSMFASHMHCN